MGRLSRASTHNRLLLWLLLVAPSAALAQAPAAPQKIPQLTHSATALAVEGERSATGRSSAAANPLMAVVDALQKCDQQRRARNIRNACEPVKIDEENIASASELREEALRTPAAFSLFELSGRRSTVYLYGSVHLMKKNMYPLHGSIMRRFRSADNLVVEINTAALRTRQVQDEFIRRGTLPDGVQLSDELTEPTMQQVQRVLAARGYGIQAFQHMRPWFFEQTFIAQEMLVYGYDPSAGIDTYFIQQAEESGKPIMELETLEQQLDMLSTASATEQDLSLRHTFELLAQASVQTELNRLVIDWLRGDVERMYRFMSEPVKEYPQLDNYIKRLLDDRNVNMAKKIRRWLRGKGSYFVVVGAGHLGGPNGLLALLQKKGFQADQVMR